MPRIENTRKKIKFNGVEQGIKMTEIININRRKANKPQWGLSYALNHHDVIIHIRYSL